MNRRRSGPPRGSHAKPKSASRNTARGSGELRIIGGHLRRRRLAVLDSPGLRPTPDRVRETLFNWLAFELAGRRVLDLFAGSGALGLEALSRDAGDVIFVESVSAVAETLKANLETLNAQATLHRTRADAFLNGVPETPFDVVFLDPPFRQSLLEPTCQRLESAGWLASEAWVYVESEPECTWTPPAAWQLHRELRAGDSHGRLFRRSASPA